MLFGSASAAFEQAWGPGVKTERPERSEDERS